MTLVQSIKTVYFKKVFTAEGKASRSEYWWSWFVFIIFAVISQFILDVLNEVILLLARENPVVFSSISDNYGDLILVTIFVWVIIFFWLAIAMTFVGIRRLHDIGKSGYWLLLNFIPIIGSFVLTIMFCFRSKSEIADLSI